MESGKKEITEKQKSRVSKRTKLIYWLLIDVSVAIIIFALLLYRPGRYRPLGAAPDDQKHVSTYLTNQLVPEINDKVQLDKPFDVVITEDNLNDIISHAGWPLEKNGIILYAPAALITPQAVVLMGTADMQGVQFIVTIEINPVIDGQGLLNLEVSKVKVGAMNLTLVARTLAKKMYAESIAGSTIDTSYWGTKVVASLLNEEPFEPLFPIGGKKTIKIEQITLENGQITAHLVPKP
jgi:uncharacterized protein YpmS